MENDRIYNIHKPAIQRRAGLVQQGAEAATGFRGFLLFSSFRFFCNWKLLALDPVAA